VQSCFDTSPTGVAWQASCIGHSHEFKNFYMYAEALFLI
jgi:hypothetical protein